MSFDVDGARRAGYSPAEIADHLARGRNFDTAGARRSGYSDDEIISHLRAPLQQPDQPRAEDRPSMLGSAARGVARGVTFGFADELAGVAGGVGNMIGGDGFSAGYERYRDAARRSNTLDDQTNPISAIAGQVAGGVASLPLNIVGRAAQGAGAVARFGNAVARGASSGAAGGALAGFGEGEGGLENRIGSSATGAVLGGGLGGVVGAGANAVAGVSGRVLNTLGLRNPERAADRQVLRALSRDNVDPATLVAPPVGHAADDLALVDRGGANLRNLTAAATNTPGAAQEAADRFVQNRRMARPDRVAGAVDQNLGGGGGTRVMDDMDALRAMRSNDARHLYDAAFAAQAPDTPAVQQIMNMPVVQQAMRENLEWQAMTARGGHFQPSQMQMLDAAKRGLDDRINATLDTVTGRVIGGRGTENIALTELRDALLREMDAVPEYAAARAAWAGPTQTMEAMRVGQSALRLNPDALAEQVRRIGTAGNMDAARVGLGRAITDEVRSPATGVSATRRLSEDRNHLRRIETLVPDNAQREALLSALRREDAMGQVEHAINPRAGSQTTRLQSGQADMEIDPSGGMMGALLMGRLGSATAQGIGSLIRRTQGMNSHTADALTKVLLETDQGRNSATVQRLMRQSQSDQLTSQQRAALAAALMQSMGSTASMTAN